jgi:hypothetical protein
MPTQQQGYGPGFPPPLGIEQYFGQPQPYGGYPQHWSFPQQFTPGFPQQHGGAMPSLFPGQMFPGQQHLAAQPLQVQALVSQLLPIAQQVILPQVVATATQQIPYHLQQLVISQLGQQAGWQQPGWQQAPFGRPSQGSF